MRAITCSAVACARVEYFSAAEEMWRKGGYREGEAERHQDRYYLRSGKYR